MTLHATCTFTLPSNEIINPPTPEPFHCHIYPIRLCILWYMMVCSEFLVHIHLRHGFYRVSNENTDMMDDQIVEEELLQTLKEMAKDKSSDDWDS